MVRTFLCLYDILLPQDHLLYIVPFGTPKYKYMLTSNCRSMDVCFCSFDLETKVNYVGEKFALRSEINLDICEFSGGILAENRL